MDNVGIVVEDLDAAIAFFTELVLGAVYWLSRRSLRRYTLPLRAELDRCLAGLEEQGGS